MVSQRFLTVQSPDRPLPAYTNKPPRDRESVKAKLTMKCQLCEKTATFHITELTDPEGPSILHLCEEHARSFFQQEGPPHPATALNNMLAKQLKLEKAAEDIAQSDKKKCPMCGISFAEFRKGGRLGCPYDYVAFEEDLEPLLVNIHGATTHVGKIPSNPSGSPQRQFRLKQLKEEMKQAVESEQYEAAGKLRDRIAAIEQGVEADEEIDHPAFDDFQAAPPSKPSTPGKPTEPEAPEEPGHP
jgi:protein arginine kinase activator